MSNEVVEGEIVEDVDTKAFTDKEQNILNKVVDVYDKALTGFDKSLDYDNLSSRDIYALTALASGAATAVNETSKARAMTTAAEEGDGGRGVAIAILQDIKLRRGILPDRKEVLPELVGNEEVIIVHPGELNMGIEKVSMIEIMPNKEK